MVKVLKSFNGKEEGRHFSRGNTYVGDRAEQLAELGYVEYPEEKKEDLTVKDIKEQLDEKGIEYDSKEKKAELLAKLEGE